MMLVLLIAVLVLGGVVAGLAGTPRASRLTSLVALGADLVLLPIAWIASPGEGSWAMEFRAEWIPRFGISLHLGLDGVSFVLVLLTLLLGILAVACSWTEIRERVGFFHFNLLWVLAGVVGVFLALDLFLFYFFWELMLVPMYFLIGIWGHEKRVRAAIQFFLFTQASGLLMLLAILGLVFAHADATGTTTFDAIALGGTPLGPTTEMLLFLGFVVAFAVKLPAVPLHTWLPDAHTEAPTAGSVVLAGLLLKTGGYGLLRFAVPLFPEAAVTAGTALMVLGVVGIFYGALLAFAQVDLKRLVAYTSVSHLGFVLLGVFAWNALALQGVVLQMICHGLSTGALFILVGLLQERTGTRDLRRLGGLWAVMPRMGTFTLVFAMASLGLPGLGNFVAEFLILVGVFRESVALGAVATLGLVAATAYSLRLIQEVLHGSDERDWRIPDLSAREAAVCIVLAGLLVGLGLFPQPVFDATASVVAGLPGVLPG